MKGMRAASQAVVLEAVDAALAAGADGARLASDLFAVVGALDQNVTLRRILTEPPVPLKAKVGLLGSLLGDRVADSTMEVLKAAVATRWAHGTHLADGLERAAVCAQVTDDGGSGAGGGVEDDLFRFNRVLEAEPELRAALADPFAPLEARQRLLGSLVDGKVGAPTRALLGQALNGRHGKISEALAYYQEVAAARSDRLIATARVAAPLSDEHKQRLVSALAALYDQSIHLNQIVDPDVLGGVRVKINDEVIDSSVESRLADVQRGLAL